MHHTAFNPAESAARESDGGLIDRPLAFLTLILLAARRCAVPSNSSTQLQATPQPQPITMCSKVLLALVAALAITSAACEWQIGREIWGARVDARAHAPSCWMGSFP